jgi:NAD(P) transhydrogenase subunit alpha
LENETVLAMKPGSVIVDMAASTGGNCALTVNDSVTVTDNGVQIIGNSNLPSTMPQDASKMYGKNILNLLKLLISNEGVWNINLDDDIIKGCTITLNGALINERLKPAPVMA